MANDPVGYSDVPDGFSVESHGVATATLPPPATQPAYADVPDGFEVEHTPAAQQAAPAQPHPAMPTPTEPQAAAQAQQPAGSPFGGGPLPGEAYQERVTPPTKLPVAEQAPTAPKTQTPAGPTQADLDIQDATWSIAAKLPKVSPRPDYASHGADVAEYMAGLTPEDYFDTQYNRKIAAQLEWEAKNRSPQEKAAGDFPERLAAAYREHADALNTGQIKPGNYLPQEMTAAGQVHRMLAAYRSVDNTAAILGTDAPAKAKEDAAAVVGFKAQQMASENPELANFYIEAQNALLDDAKGKLSSRLQGYAPGFDDRLNKLPATFQRGWASQFAVSATTAIPKLAADVGSTVQQTAARISGNPDSIRQAEYVSHMIQAYDEYRNAGPKSAQSLGEAAGTAPLMVGAPTAFAVTIGLSTLGPAMQQFVDDARSRGIEPSQHAVLANGTINGIAAGVSMRIAGRVGEGASSMVASELTPTVANWLFSKGAAPWLARSFATATTATAGNAAMGGSQQAISNAADLLHYIDDKGYMAEWQKQGGITKGMSEAATGSALSLLPYAALGWLHQAHRTAAVRKLAGSYGLQASESSEILSNADDAMKKGGPQAYRNVIDDGLAAHGAKFLEPKDYADAVTQGLGVRENLHRVGDVVSAAVAVTRQDKEKAAAKPPETAPQAAPTPRAAALKTIAASPADILAQDVPKPLFDALKVVAAHDDTTSPADARTAAIADIERSTGQPFTPDQRKAVNATLKLAQNQARRLPVEAQEATGQPQAATPSDARPVPVEGQAAPVPPQPAAPEAAKPTTETPAGEPQPAPLANFASQPPKRKSFLVPEAKVEEKPTALTADISENGKRVDITPLVDKVKPALAEFGVDPLKTLATHEETEKASLAAGKTQEQAHLDALTAEHAQVAEQSGGKLTPEAYEKIMAPVVEQAGRGKYVPPDVTKSQLQEEKGKTPELTPAEVDAAKARATPIGHDISPAQARLNSAVIPQAKVDSAKTTAQAWGEPAFIVKKRGTLESAPGQFQVRRDVPTGYVKAATVHPDGRVEPHETYKLEADAPAEIDATKGKAGKQTWDKTGADMPTVHHGGKGLVETVDTSKLGKRDAGFYGAGFYVTESPGWSKTYGPTVSSFSFKPEAKILDVGTIHPEFENKGHAGLQQQIEAGHLDDLKKNAVDRVKNDPEKLQGYADMVKPGSGAFDLHAWIGEVNKYAKANGYDAIRWSKSEIVVLNPDSLTKPGTTGTAAPPAPKPEAPTRGRAGAGERKPWQMTRDEYQEHTDTPEGADKFNYHSYASDSPPRGSSIPDHNFEAPDLETGSVAKTEAVVREHYAKGDPSKEVYKAYIPIEDIPTPKIEGDLGDEYKTHFSSSFPAVVLKSDKAGNLKILDGNHRIAAWNESGYTHVPAWIVDDGGHRSEVTKAVRQGKPVPREVVTDYAGEKWADDYLKKTPDSGELHQAAPADDMAPEARAEIEDALKRNGGDTEKIIDEYKKDFGARITPEVEADIREKIGQVKGEQPPAKQEQTGDATEKLIGMKNAAVDQQLAEIGRPPATHAEKVSFDDFARDAAAKVKADKFAGNKLIQNLKTNPRPLTGAEDALLLHETNRLSLARDEAEKQEKIAATGEPSAALAAHVATEQIKADYATAMEMSTLVGHENSVGLSFRRMMMAKDYSLARMELEIHLALGDKKLTPEQQKTQDAKTAVLHDRIMSLEKERDAAAVELEKARSGKATAEATAEAVKAAAAKAKPSFPRKASANPADKTYGTRNTIVTKASIEKDLADLRTMTFDLASVPAAAAKMLVKVGMYHIEAGLREFGAWSRKMAEDVGEKVKPHLDDIWKEANGQFNEAQRTDLIGKMKSMMTAENPEERRELNTMSQYLTHLAQGHAADGITNPDKMVDALHEDMKKIDPNIDRKAVEMSWTRLDKPPKETNRTPDQKTELDLRGQERTLVNIRRIRNELESIENRKPLKSGDTFEREPPSLRQRQLTKELNAEMKKLGISTAGPDSLASAMDAKKTGLRNKIEELQDAVNLKRQIVKGEPRELTDEDVKTLQAEKDGWQAQYDALFPKDKTVPDEQRIAAGIKAAQKSLDMYNERLRTGKLYADKKPPGPTSPELLAVRAKRDEAASTVKELQAWANAKTPEQIDRAKVESFISRANAKVAELAERKIAGDFGPRPKRQQQAWRDTVRDRNLTRELDKADTNLKAAKDQHDADVAKYKYANRGWFERQGQRLIQLARLAAISGPNTLEKVGFSIVPKFAQTYAEEAVGGVMGKAYPALVRKGMGEAEFHPVRMTKSMFGGAWRGVKEWKQVVTNKSALDVMHSPAKYVLPPKAIEFFNRLHAMEKNPDKVAHYEFAYMKRLNWEIEHNNLNVNDPDPKVMQDIKDEAYKRGQEAIFQEDSTAKAMFNDAFRLRNDPKTGEPTPVSVGVHTAAKTAIPVAGVPANFFNRLAETVYGFPLGAGRILFSRGTKNMTPEQVASCVRQMKRGSVMASAFIIGLCNPSNFGGFYQPGQRKDEDVGFDKIRLWGWDVPRAFTQLPIFQAMQFGATITRLYNYFHDKGKDDTESAFHAIVQAGLGGAEKVPFVGEMMHTETLKNNPAGWFWQKVLGVVNPQAVQQPAKWFDQDAQGETIRRKAEDAFWNPTQNAELGLPGLRKNVPVNTGRDTLDFVKAYNDAGAAQRRAMLPELRHKIDEMRLGKMEADKAWGAQGNRPTGKKHFVGHTKDDIDAVNKALRQGPPELRGLRANYYTPAPDDEDTEP